LPRLTRGVPRAGDVAAAEQHQHHGRGCVQSLGRDRREPEEKAKRR
jgi:hypothetical protein